MTRLSVKRLISSLCMLTIVMLWTLPLRADPNFVYTNDDANPNTVSAFSVGVNGELTLIPGSPFPTGGAGSGFGLFAANRITIRAVGNFLYVSNSASDNVSAFSINPTTGVLTPVPGSPFATGAGQGGGLEGISLGVTPDGQFLLAGNPDAMNITVFSIAPNGALTPIPGSPFPAGGTPDGMKVSPDGQFLAVALLDTVAMFSIAPNGNLTPVPGSPFPNGGVGESPAGVDINCASDRLFAGEANNFGTIVDVYSIAVNGALTPIPGSPFLPDVGVNSNVVLLSPDDQLLFVSNQYSNSVTVFDVASNGSLTLVPGSPFPLSGGGAFPTGMATNEAGTLLYIAQESNVFVFHISLNGNLTPVPGSPFSTGQPSEVNLVAFPSKTCQSIPPHRENIDAFVTFEPLSATFSFTPDPAGCPEEFVGTFSFEARLTNVSKSSLSGLVVAVTTLTNGNLLHNADGGPGGVGAQLTVPQQDGFSDGVLSPEEFVDVPFIICLQERQPFQFIVDVFGFVEASADAEAKVPLLR